MILMIFVTCKIIRSYIEEMVVLRLPIYNLYNNLVNNKNLSIKLNDIRQSVVQSILNSKLRNIYYIGHYL